MIQKPPYIAYMGRVYERFQDAPAVKVLSYSNDVVIGFKVLRLYPATNFLRTQDLTCILTNKPPTGYVLLGEETPTLPWHLANLELELQSLLRFSVGARFPTATQDVTFQDGILAAV